MTVPLSKEMEQMKEEKDDEIKNITEKYETTVSKLKNELDDEVYRFNVSEQILPRMHRNSS